jgi:hypothetical protein
MKQSTFIAVGPCKMTTTTSNNKNNDWTNAREKKITAYCLYSNSLLLFDWFGGTNRVLQQRAFR